MRQLSFIIIMLAGYISSAGRAEHTVINGGGQGEQNILYSFMNFERFALMCKAIGTCADNDNDRNALADINTHLSEVVNRPDFIIFSTPDQDARLIDQNGNALTFVMASGWGSSVTINRNALYRASPGSTVLPIPVPDALSIVAEVLLRQRANLAPDRIPVLSGRMARLASGAFEEVVVGHGAVWVESDRLLRFSAWKFPRATMDGYASEVTIQDSDATHVITDDISAAVRCQEHFHHRPDQMLIRGLSIAQESGNIEAEVRAEVIFTCEDDNRPGTLTHSVGRLKIIAGFGTQPVTPPSYVLASLSVRAE